MNAFQLGKLNLIGFADRTQLRDAGEPIRHPLRTVRIARERVKSVARNVAKKVTAEVQASRQLQGKYISMIRQLPKNRRAKYAAIAKKDGREAAISAMSKASR